MRSTLLVAFIAVLSLQMSAAREIRRDAIPESFWGTWAPSTAGCNDADKSPVVLSAKSYAGPAGRCVVDFVMEVPGRDSAIYSAHMSCSGSPPQAGTMVNLIMRPDTAEQISLGTAFDNLAMHRRCPAGEPAKQR